MSSERTSSVLTWKASGPSSALYSPGTLASSSRPMSPPESGSIIRWRSSTFLAQTRRSSSSLLPRVSKRLCIASIWSAGISGRSSGTCAASRGATSRPACWGSASEWRRRAISCPVARFPTRPWSASSWLRPSPGGVSDGSATCAASSSAPPRHTRYGVRAVILRAPYDRCEPGLHSPPMVRCHPDVTSHKAKEQRSFRNAGATYSLSDLKVGQAAQVVSQNGTADIIRNIRGDGAPGGGDPRRSPARSRSRSPAPSMRSTPTARAGRSSTTAA